MHVREYLYKLHLYF